MKIGRKFSQKKTLTYLVLAVFAGFFLASGCAKKAISLNPPQAETIETEPGEGEKTFDQSGRFAGAEEGIENQGFMIREDRSGLSEETLTENETISPFGNSGAQTEESPTQGKRSRSGGLNDFMSDNSGSDSSQIARILPFHTTSNMDDVHFQFDKYDLDIVSKSILQKNAEWLKQHPEIKVEIQGHADERGTNNYNLGLGERRAQSVKKYLMALGVEKDRLFAISYGEEKPFCDESNDSCWSQNRCGHLLIATS